MPQYPFKRIFVIFHSPYDGKWSKTMVGYGPEDSNFVLELTYNYGIGDYPRGNDLLGIEVASSEVSEDDFSSHFRLCLFPIPHGSF
ncbi:unnamed protein product [Cyprideis torosa]|uniref:Uncharacterized protein n=1 Tax=Cyprideis torosa TaxID=163714 RepID=A0A7R8ZR99_9CRUS|nr:unnamed protein product [Cyprideis torosa]CAG0892498.1 unnamed protein product [Cyprideis torosa]